ncbi:RT0821/Lpp0805 family surface protein [Bdellovibrio bacteriovorus]
MKKNLIIGSLIVTSLVQYTSPAFANKEIIGSIIGGVIGAGVGSTIGKGNGNKAAIAIGAIAGTIIGNKVGQDLDEADRRAIHDAQSRMLRQGGNCDWDGRNYGSRTGSRGRFTSVREGYNHRTGEFCREYTSIIYTRRGTEETRGVACSRPDGSWYETRETEVNFNRRGNGNGGYNGGGRHNGGNRHNEPPRYNPAPPPAPSRPLPPPPPPTNRYGYEGQTQLSQITRRTGGEWFRVTLHQSVSLENIQIYALAAGLKVHDTTIYTESGRRVQVYQLTNTRNIYSGDTLYSENLNLGSDRVTAIDLRVESMGGYAEAIVKVTSNETYPSLSVSRY